jgi:hypothetical protein
MIIGHRAHNTDPHADDQPEDILFDKIVDVTVTLLGISARAEKHHHSKGKKPDHGDQEEVDAAALHGS